jgi:hypothetical protein
MSRALAIGIFASVMMVAPLFAQSRGAIDSSHAGGAISHATSASGGAGSGVGITSRSHQGRANRRYGPGGYPYNYPFLDDYGYGLGYGYDSDQAGPPPQAGVVPPAPAPTAGTPAPAVEPLLIEWHGDHFERMTLSQKSSSEEGTGPDYSAKSERLSKDAAQTAHALPPAVVVFRDGRKEELSAYSIISGTIYSNADYWNSGSWTKKIQIADLDVPATIKLNHDRGVDFVLPAGPNEVVLRP